MALAAEGLGTVHCTLSWLFSSLTTPSNGYGNQGGSVTILCFGMCYHLLAYRFLAEPQGSQPRKAALHQRVFLKGMQSIREHSGAGSHAYSTLQAGDTSHRWSRASRLCHHGARGGLKSPNERPEMLSQSMREAGTWFLAPDSDCRTRAIEMGLNSDDSACFAETAVSYLI